MHLICLDILYSTSSDSLAKCHYMDVVGRNIIKRMPTSGTSRVTYPILIEKTLPRCDLSTLYSLSLSRFIREKAMIALRP